MVAIPGKSQIIIMGIEKGQKLCNEINGQPLKTKEDVKFYECLLRGMIIIQINMSIIKILLLIFVLQLSSPQGLISQLANTIFGHHSSFNNQTSPLLLLSNIFSHFKDVTLFIPCMVRAMTPCPVSNVFSQ